MDNKPPGFPPETYSSAFNLRNEIKQYLLTKGVGKPKNGVLKLESLNKISKNCSRYVTLLGRKSETHA
ncbi:Hypothetical protein NTJ_10229 [Nesidiocoris tenuis]|uniref:Uncharacterized protein n=1 Tax=Nesidiocoris tenuis TaxID=355587 RepID=A0ABN7AZ23_9HEMI|nr:Hypothetical protein NTJ_10229 [Nesidiocoris tenuis]